MVLLAKTFGCVRFVWNRYVETFNFYDKDTNPTPYFQTSTEIRNEFDWMQEVSAAALQQKEADFKEYKNQKFNKTRKKQLGRPKFKKKFERQSFRLPNQKFYIKDDKIQLEKIGKVKIVLDRQIPDDVKYVNVTVSKNKANQYFASVLVEEMIQPKSKTGKDAGIDVGLTCFLKSSEGDDVDNPRYFRENQAKLAHLQRLQSRKRGSKKGEKKSVRWLKLQARINRLHQLIANQRNHFLHCVSKRLVDNYDTIYSETLNVAGLLRNHKLAKSISDASWSTLFKYIGYKCMWYGKEHCQIGMFEPSTKTCSQCGKVNHAMTLKDRVFVCPHCGFTIDRDFNAAINIKAFGVKNAIRTQSDAHE
jgi:putative transposase